MKFTKLLAFAVAGLLLAIPLASLHAQPVDNVLVSPSVNSFNHSYGAVITQAVGTALSGNTTTNSAMQFNNGGKGVICSYHETAVSGSASVTWGIQIYDAASAVYTTITSVAVQSSATDSSLAVYPGIASTGLPAGMTSFSFHLPSMWRVTFSAGGASGPGIAATVGCEGLM